jgi:hypothetical protein
VGFLAVGAGFDVSVSMRLRTREKTSKYLAWRSERNLFCFGFGGVGIDYGRELKLGSFGLALHHLVMYGRDTGDVDQQRDQ